MKAVVFVGKVKKVVVRDVPKQKITNPLDAIVRVTTAAICGTDTQTYNGRLGAEPPLITGHETIGIVEEVGPGVTHPKQGDRVVITAFISCGHCDNCTHAMASLRTTVDPPIGGAAFGIGSVGSQIPGRQGTSTELLLKITRKAGHLR